MRELLSMKYRLITELIIIFLLISCHPQKQERYSNDRFITNERLLEKIYNDYYYTDRLNYQKFNLFTLIWVYDHTTLNQYIREEIPKLELLMYKIIDDLTLNDIYMINPDKIDFNLILLPYQNEYLNFKERQVSGSTFHYMRTAFILDYTTLEELEEKDILIAFNETIIHEFTHILFSGVHRSNLKDEIFATFVSLQFTELDPIENNKNLSQIRDTFNTQITNLNQDYHNINEIIDSELPKYMKENISAVFICFLYETSQFNKIKTFMSNQKVNEYGFFHNNDLYNDFLDWLKP